eukprot:565908-Amphidinium_carterae.1
MVCAWCNKWGGRYDAGAIGEYVYGCGNGVGIDDAPPACRGWYVRAKRPSVQHPEPNLKASPPQGWEFVHNRRWRWSWSWGKSPVRDRVLLVRSGCRRSGRGRRGATRLLHP